MNHIQFNYDLLNLKNKLHIYAMRLTSATDRADDLVQETMLKALMFSDKFREGTNFNAWVYTIMRNTFINDYRRLVKTRITFDDSHNDYNPRFSNQELYPAPDSFYITREIQLTITALKDEFKIPFNLFLEGFRYKEIAEQLDLPLGTVKSRIFFTRKKLEIALKEFSEA
jgi:RNA polymerase sigma factor (sigma-70 family)